MNHPKPDELAEFIYDELEPARQTEIAQHLKACADCSQQIGSWRSVRGELAGWKTPIRDRSTAPSRQIFPQPLRWAAAAIILLSTGFGLARMTAPRVDLPQLHADLASELREEVRQELKTELTKYSADQLAQQAEFQEAVAQSINRLAVQQVAQHSTLRKDVETVAIHAQEEFDRIASMEHMGAKVQPIGR